MDEQEETTIIDRFAIAFLSAVTAFITASIIWAMVGFLLGQANLISYWPFNAVIIFTVIMAVLGFLVQSNLIATILAVCKLGLITYNKSKHVTPATQGRTVLVN
ncbi:MAG: hypothetical protein MI808_08205 [Pseudomonadales bacterium]|nr:hypothetical protein [Pseudomonadales bacterium]